MNVKNNHQLTNAKNHSKNPELKCVCLESDNGQRLEDKANMNATNMKNKNPSKGWAVHQY